MTTLLGGQMTLWKKCQNYNPIRFSPKLIVIRGGIVDKNLGSFWNCQKSAQKENNHQIVWQRWKASKMCFFLSPVLVDWNIHSSIGSRPSLCTTMAKLLRLSRSVSFYGDQWIICFPFFGNRMHHNKFSTKNPCHHLPTLSLEHPNLSLVLAYSYTPY
jgi:hypothetical protein